MIQEKQTARFYPNPTGNKYLFKVGEGRVKFIEANYVKSPTKFMKQQYFVEQVVPLWNHAEEITYIP